MRDTPVVGFDYDDLIVTIAHLRAAGMCARQPRQWMARNGLDWTEFITNGYSVKVLRATGDALVEPVIAIAKAESGR